LHSVAAGRLDYADPTNRACPVDGIRHSGRGRGCHHLVVCEQRKQLLLE
jgi:hypothetical protein